MVDVGEDGNFEFVIDSGQLSKGLRPSKRMPRNSGFLTECKGAVGLDGVLEAIEEVVRLDTSAIATAFPYPQIFVFTNCIIICNQTAIYEWIAGSPVLMLDDLTAGSIWSAVDFYDYVYLSNGRVTVVRDVKNTIDGKIYSVISTLPHATAICNFNGQVLVGAPDVDADITTLVMPVGILSLTTEALGEVIVGKVFSGTLNLSIKAKGEIG